MKHLHLRTQKAEWIRAYEHKVFSDWHFFMHSGGWQIHVGKNVYLIAAVHRCLVTFSFSAVFTFQNKAIAYGTFIYKPPQSLHFHFTFINHGTHFISITNCCSTWSPLKSSTMRESGINLLAIFIWDLISTGFLFMYFMCHNKTSQEQLWKHALKKLIRTCVRAL